MDELSRLLAEIRGCGICARHLPLGPRPVLRAGSTARLLIVGQAPGTRVHETGVPWNDPSGERLRDWLQIPPDVFYDETRVAIMPMGFCYPGRDKKGGDKPPRPECAPEWHPKILPLLPELSLTLLVGGYAQKHYLGPAAAKSVTETVRAWRDYLPRFLPTPHPSWRTIHWQRRNPWFEAEVIPEMRRRVRTLL
ncbi:MAG: uracil-DNA glycosylase family protein [Rhodospirillales bacterium]